MSDSWYASQRGNLSYFELLRRRMLARRWRTIWNKRLERTPIWLAQSIQKSNGPAAILSIELNPAMQQLYTSKISNDN
jgi:hypothetical protein